MSNRTLSNVLDDLSEVDDDLMELKKKRADLVKESLVRMSDDIRTQLHGKDYGCGTANVDAGEYKVKVTVPKKVIWNQDTLKLVRDEIVKQGGDPTEYMKVKFDVSETAYTNWPSHIQASFEPAREVKAGTATVKYEVKK